MRNLIILLMALFLASCANSRLVTETKSWVEYRDTVIQLDPIQVRLPQSDIHVDLLIKEKAGKLNLSRQEFKRGLITVSVEVIDNRLLVDASIPDSLLVKPDPVRIEDAIVEKKEEKQIVIPEKYIPWPYKWCFRIVLLEIVLALLYFGKKYSWGNIFSRLFSIFSRRGV